MPKSFVILLNFTDREVTGRAQPEPRVRKTGSQGGASP